MEGDPVTETTERKAEVERAVRVATATFLASSLVHDLSQPISAINAWSAACRQHAQQDPHVEALVGEKVALLSAESERATRTLRGFKEVMPRATRDPVAVDLEDLLHEVAALLAGDAAVLDAEVRVAAEEGGSYRLTTVPEVVRMALYILCRNGLDALEAPSLPRRELVLRLQARDGKAQVLIEDSGQGIAAAVRQRLFEPFVSGRPHGLGLGLAVCRYALESISGRIWLASQSSAGTTFGFELPLEAVNTDV